MLCLLCSFVCVVIFFFHMSLVDQKGHGFNWRGTSYNLCILKQGCWSETSYVKCWYVNLTNHPRSEPLCSQEKKAQHCSFCCILSRETLLYQVSRLSVPWEWNQLSSSGQTVNVQHDGVRYTLTYNITLLKSKQEGAYHPHYTSVVNIKVFLKKRKWVSLEAQLQKFSSLSLRANLDSEMQFNTGLQENFRKRSVKSQYEHKDWLLQAKPLPVFIWTLTVVLRQTWKNSEPVL